MLQDGIVKRAFDARLKVAVQVNELQDVLVILTFEHPRAGQALSPLR